MYTRKIEMYAVLWCFFPLVVGSNLGLLRSCPFFHRWLKARQSPSDMKPKPVLLRQLEMP